ncbi:MAG: hypothetical protein WD355_06900 [Balneolaceae bacterium]
MSIQHSLARYPLLFYIEKSECFHEAFQQVEPGYRECLTYNYKKQGK